MKKKFVEFNFGSYCPSFSFTCAPSYCFCLLFPLASLFIYLTTVVHLKCARLKKLFLKVRGTAGEESSMRAEYCITVKYLLTKLLSISYCFARTFRVHCIS